MGLEHFVGPESKEDLKGRQGHAERPQVSHKTATNDQNSKN